MDEQDLPNLELDPRFPSGDWTGFYLQYWMPGRHTTNVHLTWQDGELAGNGSDRVGSYNLAGTYDAATGRCEWTKTYLGRHSVTYRGVNDGHGIWGVWELPQLGGLFIDRGGFHLWPEGTEVSEESDRTEQALLTLMRKEFGGHFYRLLRILLILGFTVRVALLLWRRWTD